MRRSNSAKILLIMIVVSLFSVANVPSSSARSFNSCVNSYSNCISQSKISFQGCLATCLFNFGPDAEGCQNPLNPCDRDLDRCGGLCAGIFGTNMNLCTYAYAICVANYPPVPSTPSGPAIPSGTGTSTQPAETSA